MKPLTCDAHVDVLWVLSGLAQQKYPTVSTPRMRFGGLDRMVMALYLSEPTQNRMGENSAWRAIEAQLAMAKVIFSEHYLAVEGARVLGRDPIQMTRRLKQLADEKIKYLTLVHNTNNLICGSSNDHQMGLTRLGRDLIDDCEEYGILVDVSHASDTSIFDILNRNTGKPIIASHSGCRMLTNHARNLTDGQIVDIGKTGGVVCVPFARKFVGSAAGVADHIDRICNLTGSVLRVGIGSDLDGAEMVAGVRGAEDWSTVVINGLADRGFSDEQIEAIAGGNLLRLFNAA